MMCLMYISVKYSVHIGFTQPKVIEISVGSCFTKNIYVFFVVCE